MEQLKEEKERLLNGLVEAEYVKWTDRQTALSHSQTWFSKSGNANLSDLLYINHMYEMRIASYPGALKS